MTATLVEQLRAAREIRVEVEPGKFVRVRRPLQVDLPKLLRGMTLEHVVEHLAGWDITQADVFPPGVGASDPLPFSVEMAREVIGDRVQWLVKLQEAMSDSITAFLTARGEIAKNSQPS